MKKVIITVSAIVVLLTVNLAFARSPIPVMDPIDPAIETLTNWVTTLQGEVQGLFNRVTILETATTPKTFKVLDVNNNKIGLVYGVKDPNNIYMWDITRNEIIDIYLTSSSLYDKFLNINQRYYITNDCTGTPYIDDNQPSIWIPAQNVLYRDNDSINSLENWEYIVLQLPAQPIIPNSMWHTDDHTCYQVTEANLNYLEMMESDLPTYSGPLKVVLE